MFGVYFGKYLEDKGVLTNQQYNDIISDNKNAKVKMGIMAVEAGLMTEQQADEINTLQQQKDKRFGDLAVERGYLTTEQVQHLLGKQGDGYLLFVQKLVEKGIMTLDEIQKELNAYKKSEKFSAYDMEAIKSGDIDKLVQVFIRDNSIPSVVKDYIALTSRNVVRFIDRYFRLEKVEMLNEYTSSYVAAQEMTGEYRIFSGWCGNGGGIKEIAQAYAKEEFEQVDMDALDAVCEFLNCNNGLFVTQLGEQDCEMDMLPPIMKDTVTTIRSDEGNMFRIPVCIKDKQVDLIICVQSDWVLS